MKSELKTYDKLSDYEDYTFTTTSPIQYAYELATAFIAILVQRDYNCDTLVDKAFVHILLQALDYASIHDCSGNIQEALDDILLYARNDSTAYCLQSHNVRKKIGRVIQLLMKRCILDLSNQDEPLHKK